MTIDDDAGPAAMTFQVQDDLMLATRNNEVLVYRASDLAVLDRYDRTDSS